VAYRKCYDIEVSELSKNPTEQELTKLRYDIVQSILRVDPVVAGMVREFLASPDMAAIRAAAREAHVPIKVLASIYC
jgi:hypothetical protein